MVKKPQYSSVMRHNEDAETALIGALFIEPSLFDEFEGKLKRRLFYKEKNKLFFDAMLEVHRSGVQIDVVTLKDYFQRKNLFSFNEEEGKVSAYELATLDKDNIYRDWFQNQGAIEAEKNLRNYINILSLNAINQAQAQALSRLSTALMGGSDEEIADAQKEYDELREATSANNFLDDFQPPTKDEYRRIMKTASSGITLNYVFQNSNGVKRRLVLPSGALSLFCAPTSHGKSTFLRNIALDLTMSKSSEQDDGIVLYFTFEESQQELWAQMLNLYINKNLNRANPRDTEKNNHATIKEYYQKDTTTYISGDMQAEFAQKVAMFEKHVIYLNDPNNDGHLQVINKNYDISELVGAIKAYSRAIRKNGKSIKAVFIDYIQLLTAKGKHSNKKEELSEVCNELMHLSIAMDIPFVLAAQLIRETKSPLKMFNQNISDASDIEKCANLIVCLWNSNQEAQEDEYYYTVKPKADKEGVMKGGTKNPETLRLEARGFFAGPNKYANDPMYNALPPNDRLRIYAKITKYRGNEVGQDAVFKWNPNTGYIEKNYVKGDAQMTMNIPSSKNPFDPSNF